MLHLNLNVKFLGVNVGYDMTMQNYHFNGLANATCHTLVPFQISTEEFVSAKYGPIKARPTFALINCLIFYMPTALYRR